MNVLLSVLAIVIFGVGPAAVLLKGTLHGFRKRDFVVVCIAGVALPVWIAIFGVVTVGGMLVALLYYPFMYLSGVLLRVVWKAKNKLLDGGSSLGDP